MSMAMNLGPKPVVALPRLTTPDAASLAAKMKPQPPAQALLKPGMSSSEYIHALEQNKMSGEAIKGLAHGMPERDSVWYATQSSRRVEGAMSPADRKAMEAAESWVKNPSPDSQAQAAAAAAAANHSGPGAWAAQGAAWSSETPGGVVPATPGLTPHATANSVQLASALEANGSLPKSPEIPPVPEIPPQPEAPQLEVPQFAQPEIKPPEVVPPPTPEANAKTAEVQQPYVDLGKDVASGKNSWA